MSQGSVLTDYIYKHCKSRRAFCADIGFRESTVANWCNDNTPIPLHKIAIMAEFFEEITKEPPHVFIFRLVMQETTVAKVISTYQRSKYEIRSN